MKFLFRVIFILFIFCTVSDGVSFSEEPPKNWVSRILMHEWPANDPPYAGVRLSGPKSNYFLFGQFMLLQDKSISWSKGKGGKWIGELERYDKKTGKTNKAIMVFIKLKLSPSFSGILLKRININGIEMTEIQIRKTLINFKKRYMAKK